MTEEHINSDIHSRIDRIEVTLSHVTDTLEKMAAVVNRPHDTKWGPIMTAIGLLFVAGSGYTTLTTSPLARENHRMTEQILVLQERDLQMARALGRMEGLMGIDNERR